MFCRRTDISGGFFGSRAYLLGFHLPLLFSLIFRLSAYPLSLIWNTRKQKVRDNYNNYDQQEHQNLFHYRIEKISNVFAITCMVLAFVYILFAVIYTSCGGMSNDGDGAYYEHSSGGGGMNNRQWANNYEMSTRSVGGGDRRRQRRRRHMRNSLGKEEPLVGGGGCRRGG